MSADHQPPGLAIIGAGPAGLSAAVEAASHGVPCRLFDEQGAPGGQIYRALESTPLRERSLLGADYWRGGELIESLRHGIEAGLIDYRPEHTLWQLNRERELGTLARGRAALAQASQVIVASGAQERPFPVPGWTLPGVMGAGAAQVLLKSSGVALDQPLVLAGCGPLLLLVAAQYLRAGVPVAALLDTSPKDALRRAAPYLATALGAPDYLLKGIKLIRELRRHGVNIVRGVEALRAEGDGQLERVGFKRQGQWQEIIAKTLLLHQGVVPNVQLSRALSCRHRWREDQLCWVPELDPWGESDAQDIFFAGDGGGIVGAEASKLQGRLSALQVAARLGAITAARRDEIARPLRRALARELRIRPFLDALYRPNEAWRRPSDETVVCRCEEIDAGQVRAAVRAGCSGPNQLKAFLRCGMGPCQGRMCGLTVAELIGETQGRPTAEVGYYRLRSPIKPITLGQLAELEIPEPRASKTEVD
ncbi:NAD(P)/FAD-dependent oxidoreductase [Halotalea alkalilenta]|uniref:FAD/NAD(P)-binding oxidoreductase n=1 Tax=Halotalea alkalilenta TaxID=376489 RepID=A0A172YDS2_9GAMM|nr:FAD/NAD(P)-binding oxidoreductase [Halotalea alkalilenta]ANF57387.1 FAD/NAD(P)-binding oxidoreductase [Halotalea alkalilenta]